MSEDPELANYDMESYIRLVEQRAGAAAGPLERLGRAVELSQEMAAVTDLMVDHFVQAARAAGHSWSEVGQILGVTKQAAQQRYVHGRAGAVQARVGFGRYWEQIMKVAEFTLGEPGMKRFTADARRAVVRAREIAQEMGHSKLGTEHLLLGVLSDPSWLPGAMVVKAGVTPAAVRRKVERALGVGSVPIPDGTPVPFTPRARTVLTLAMKEALALQHHYIEPHHVLLALIREGGGWGARVLDELGLDLALLRKNLVLATAERARAASEEAPGDEPGAGVPSGGAEPR